MSRARRNLLGSPRGGTSRLRWWPSAMVVTFAVSVFVAGSAFASNDDFAWARQMGGTASDAAVAVAVDGSGNVYTVGNFVSGPADFDPGAGTSNLSSAGGLDVFVSKLDADGDFLWAGRLGGTADDYGQGLALDGLGNVYITGAFHGTADFDPGAGTFNLTPSGPQEVFVSKLDTDGEFVWARQLGGTGNDWAYAVAVDGSGNVYTTGYFQGTADFDPGAGTENLVAVHNPSVFVSKLDADGDFVWARRLGGSEGFGIAVDVSDNVYTVGTFEGTEDFDPGAGTFNLSSAGAFDTFVSKLEADGDFVWARQLGGTADDFPTGVAVDVSGNVYTTGFFTGTADFDPGAGTSNLTPAGSQDAFVSKLDAAGDFGWAHQLGGSGTLDAGFGLAVDGSDNVYTTGYFQGTADFDPGAGTFNLTAAGTRDTFVWKTDGAGDLLWARQVGGTGASASASGVDVDGSGSVYVVGGFGGTVDFDPGAGTFNLIGSGGDAFVVKLGDITDPEVTPPDDVVEEATGPSGAVVTFGSGSATDNVAVTSGPTCLPASGSTFAITDTTVTCSASDAAGNEGEATFTVTVQDTTDPVVTPPSDVVEEATGSSGAVVTFGSGSATDAVGVTSGPTCLPASGSTFAITDTTVTCSASDAAGNEGQETFTVTVQDTTDPAVTAVSDVVVEPAGPGGAVATFASGSATDAVGVTSGPACAPASGSTFVIGVTEVTCAASDDAGNIGEDTLTVTVVDTPGVVRYSGVSRFATAAAVSAGDFPVASDVDIVFVAVGSNFPDALAGAAVAGKLGAPLLLVNTTSIPADTAAELTRLSPDTIVVLGGPGVINAGVETALGGYATTVIRLSGANRYATAVAISQYGFPGTATEVVVATGLGFADALAGGPAAVALGGPVLLTNPTDLPQAVADEITRLAPTRIVVVGGTSAVSATVFAQLQALVANTVRISGANRYATAVALSLDAFDDSVRVYVATGLNFPDALAGAAAAGWWRAPILLVPATSVPADVSAEITRLGATKAIIVGGTSAVSAGVLTTLETLLGI